MPRLDGALFGTGPQQPCFGCGPDHPFGFRLRFEEQGEEITTRFTPGEQYQGPPGVMHGGLVFTLVDELAAWVVIAKLGKFGFTARLGGKLLAPVRIGAELEGRARLVRKTTRTAEVHAELAQAGVRTFEGAVTFALLGRAAAEKLIGRPMPEEWARWLL